MYKTYELIQMPTQIHRTKKIGVNKIRIVECVH